MMTHHEGHQEHEEAPERKLRALCGKKGFKHV